MKMSIGEQIRTIRKQKGLTQEQLAEKLGIPASTIRKYESGKVQPKTERLFDIASKLGVHPSQLDSRLHWNDQYDVKQLSEDAVLWEAIIARYGEEPASTMNDFLSLNPEGQKQASEYIDFLMQKQEKK